VKKLTERDCFDAVKAGDFAPAVTGAAPAVAVVLTQSWCVQWTWMRTYLERLGEVPGWEVFWVEYDREAFFEAFMSFKEETYANREIPYVRYYREGRLVRESNFIDETGFKRNMSVAS
jgi:hypothetical protein